MPSKIDLEQHSINIHILGRQFPTKVSSEEKEVVEEAARRINAQISQFKATYHTQDDLNLAIMACLKFATDLVRISQQSDKSEQALKKTLDTLEKELNTTVLVSSPEAVDLQHNSKGCLLCVLSADLNAHFNNRNRLVANISMLFRGTHGEKHSFLRTIGLF